jgi:hypothetical protein
MANGRSSLSNHRQCNSVKLATICERQPGMKLVVFAKESQAMKASYGPLAGIHVTPTEAANSEPKPFPIVVDGETLAVDPAKLALLKTVLEPRKSRDAWTLPAVIKSVRPASAMASLLVVNAKESFAVMPAESENAFLRFNRKGR